jgi:hypothetical protein
MSTFDYFHQVRDKNRNVDVLLSYVYDDVCSLEYYVDDDDAYDDDVDNENLCGLQYHVYSLLHMVEFDLLMNIVWVIYDKLGLLR